MWRVNALKHCYVCGNDGALSRVELDQPPVAPTEENQHRACAQSGAICLGILNIALKPPPTDSSLPPVRAYT